MRSLRRSRVQLVARSHGARRGVGLRTRLAFQNFKALSIAIDSKRSLGLVGKTLNEVASLCTNFV